MKIELNDKFKTESGNILEVAEIKENGLFVMQLVDEVGNPIPEVKNSYNHVVLRSKPQYTRETIETFKKIK